MATNGKYNPVPGKIPGRVINFGGVDLVIAPLGLDGLRAFPDAMSAVETSRINPAELDQFFAAAADVLLLSLVRNHPDLTRDALMLLLDLGNVQIAVQAMCEVSGLEITKPGKAMPAFPSAI